MPKFSGKIRGMSRQTVVASPELVSLVENRIQELMLSYDRIHALGGPAPKTVRNLLNGKQFAVDGLPKLAAALDLAPADLQRAQRAVGGLRHPDFPRIDVQNEGFSVDERAEIREVARLLAEVVERLARIGTPPSEREERSVDRD